MGFRTVIMLNNDQSNQWSKDPELGSKIFTAMNRVHDKEHSDLGYGRVVECTHADTQTLAVLDFYSGFKPLSHTSWRAFKEDVDSRDITLLKKAAEELGYKLVKKNK